MECAVFDFQGRLVDTVYITIKMRTQTWVLLWNLILGFAMSLSSGTKKTVKTIAFHSWYESEDFLFFWSLRMGNGFFTNLLKAAEPFVRRMKQLNRHQKLNFAHAKFYCVFGEIFKKLFIGKRYYATKPWQRKYAVASRKLWRKKTFLSGE